MSLKEIEIKNSYTGRGEKILNDFLIPSLLNCVRYDRVTSYYSVESLLAISQGIESLFERAGKMRLIIGLHDFPLDFIEASQESDRFKEQIEQIRFEMKNKISSLSDEIERRRLATIAWMIEDGLLEVKAAATADGGIFHPKTLIFVDKNEDKVVAVGSSNETAYGLGGNFEQVMIAKSWQFPDAVKDQEHFFERLWDDDIDGLKVFEINQLTSDIIIETLGADYPNPHSIKKDEIDILAMSAEMPANFFVSGMIPSLYIHQERAVLDALSRWPVRVLLSDEVGLGKTFEAAATIKFLLKYGGIKRVLILTPKSVLKQWQEELKEHFDIDAWRYDSINKTYVSSTEKMCRISGSPIGESSPNIMLMSAQYARGSGPNNIFERGDIKFPDLLVVDEAHSARVSQDISGKKKKTKIYRMLEDVSKKIPHLILATATPMQKDAEEYHQLLKLLGLPKAWQKERNYQTSLRLISSDSYPDVSDAYNGAALLYSTVKGMRPDLEILTKAECDLVTAIVEEIVREDRSYIGNLVQQNWSLFKKAFIKLHPARLLTIRNTRRSLTEIGYRFPVRNLLEEEIKNPEEIELFYSRVFDYIAKDCFEVEKVLEPSKKINVGFVKTSYQQRVASSLYSCIKSLNRRFEKLNGLLSNLNAGRTFNDRLINDVRLSDNLEEMDDDEMLFSGQELETETLNSAIDNGQLYRTLALECSSLNSLIEQAKDVLNKYGDMKIERSIKSVLERISKKDQVLVFSRYTDTVDALIENYRKANGEGCFGVYTGNKCSIFKKGMEIKTDKEHLKAGLFSKEIEVVFCSDAASEGLNLQAARVLINVDVPWTPSRLEQRIGRVARLGQKAREVDIINVWYPNSIEARMYHRIQKRLKDTNLAIGEFPDVVASSIKDAITMGVPEDDSIQRLNEVRNSMQTKALNELWKDPSKGISTSDYFRRRLIEICDAGFDKQVDGEIFVYTLDDGSTERVTECVGNSETISLNSKIIRKCKVSSKAVKVCKDGSGNDSAFIYKGKIVKHESIIDLIGSEIENDGLFSEGVPTMLPDLERLDLRYSIECDLNDRPDLWPPKIEG